MLFISYVHPSVNFSSRLIDNLHQPKGNEDEVEKAERDYEVIDPRARGARAREEERVRKQGQTDRRGDGGRHRRR